MTVRPGQAGVQSEGGRARRATWAPGQTMPQQQQQPQQYAEKEFDLASLPTTAGTGEEGALTPRDHAGANRFAMMPIIGDIFDVIDTTQQGHVSKQDLYKAYRTGLLDPVPGMKAISPSQIEQIFDTIDANGNGAVSRDEFRHFWRDMQSTQGSDKGCLMM